MLALMVPGFAPPMDVFPVLKYVPEFLAKWKTEARRVRNIFVDDAWTWYHNGEKQRARIKADPGSVRFEGLIAKLLREREETTDSKGREGSRAWLHRPSHDRGRFGYDICHFRKLNVLLRRFSRGPSLGAGRGGQGRGHRAATDWRMNG